MTEVHYQTGRSMSRNSGKSMSRLEQLQADLQRKMLQEKEEKMVKLYNDNQAKVMDKLNSSFNGGPGNVRRFFNDRRENPSLESSMTSLDSYLLNASQRNGLNKSLGRSVKGSPVGWDKSYPLQPIERTHSGSSSGYESVNGGGKSSHGGRHLRQQSLERSKPKSGGGLSVGGGTMRRSKSQILNGTLSGGNSAHGSQQSSPTRNRPVAMPDAKMRNDEKRKLQQEMRKREVELITKIKEQQAEIDRMRQEKIKEEKAQKARLMRKPIPGSIKNMNPKSQSPLPKTSKSPDERDAAAAAAATTSTGSSQPTSPQKSSNPPKPSPSTPKTQTSKEKVQARRSSQPSDLPECTICGRRFAADRIGKHTEICAKTSSKKRKVFDPVKMRTQGTELEDFSRKGRPTQKEPKKPAPKVVAKGPAKPSNWREKHENFLQTIRQAKVVQQHVAAGGKASDLPPAPPMDTSDYVQCPHCNRKFNEAVAERHIPKCQNIKSNKKN